MGDVCAANNNTGIYALDLIKKFAAALLYKAPKIGGSAGCADSREGQEAKAAVVNIDGKLTKLQQTVNDKCAPATPAACTAQSAIQVKGVGEMTPSVAKQNSQTDIKIPANWTKVPTAADVTLDFGPGVSVTISEIRQDGTIVGKLQVTKDAATGNRTGAIKIKGNNTPFLLLDVLQVQDAEPEKKAAAPRQNQGAKVRSGGPRTKVGTVATKAETPPPSGKKPCPPGPAAEARRRAGECI